MSNQSKEISNEKLEELSLSLLGHPLEELITYIPLLRELQKLMEGPLHIQRFAGLLAMTTKPLPMDCSYVRACVIELLKKSEDFHALKALIKALAEKL